jgi:integrase
MTEAAWRYDAEVSSRQPSGHNTAKSLEHLCRLVGGDTPLASLDANRIADAARWRAAEITGRGRPVSAATVNRQIVEMARRLLRRARRVWKLNVDIDIPWGDLKLPEPEGRRPVLTTEDRQRFWSQMRADYEPIFSVYHTMGGRKAALPGLRKSAVDWERDGFTIMLKRKRGQLPREHFIPFNNETRAIFKAEMSKSPGPFVFTYEVQRGPRKGMRMPITYNGIRRVFDNAREGIDIRFHDQRHDVATRVLRKTRNLPLVGKLLGHADLSSTMRYAHVLDDDVRDGLANMSSRNYPEAAEPPLKKEETRR